MEIYMFGFLGKAPELKVDILKMVDIVKVINSY